MGLSLEQLKRGAVMAHKKGDSETARKFMAAAKREEERQPGGILQAWNVRESVDQIAPETETPEPEPTLGEQVAGAGETALAVGSGMTTGLVGGVAGALEGLAKEIIAGKFGTSEASSRIEQSSADRAQQLTYSPRTAEGQEALQGVSSAMLPLTALSPNMAFTAPTTAGAAMLAGRGIAPIARAAAAQTAAQVRPAVARAAQGVRGIMPGMPGRSPEIDDPNVRSMGAAQTGMEEIRRHDAESLPKPIYLSESEATQSPIRQAEIDRLSKIEDIGEPVRAERDLKNAALSENIEILIDRTGAKMSGGEQKSDRGKLITDVFDKGLKRAKKKTHIKYEKLKRDPVYNTPIDASLIAKHLNDNSSRRIQDGLLIKTQRQLVAMKLAEGNFIKEDLTIPRMTFGESETLRAYINSETDWHNGNEVRQAVAIRQIIDAEQDKFDNKKIIAARGARIEQADMFQDTAIIADLFSKRKGTKERSIASAEVFDKIVFGPRSSRESLEKMKDVLHKLGPDGRQAWKEIEGGTFAHIRDAALKSAQKTSTGEVSFSSHKIKQVLDGLISSGKLEILVGRESARQLEVLRDVAGYIRTSVEGAVINRSGSAHTAAAGLFDLIFSATTAVPVPVAAVLKKIIENVHDKKLKARVVQEFKVGKEREASRIQQQE